MNSTARSEFHVEKMLRKLQLAHAQGQLTKADRLMRRCLESFDAKLIAVQCAYDKMHASTRPPLSEQSAIAQKLDAWRGTDEAVVAHIRRKNSDPNTYRITMDFGVENRALQYLVGRLLTATAELQPWQFATQGGNHAAVTAVAQALQNGAMWGCEADVVDCYPSFDGEKLAAFLPLPKEVTRNVLTSKYLNISPGNIYTYFGPSGGCKGDPYSLAEALEDARRGMPQGSAASPICAERVLSVVLAQVPELGHRFSFADNTLLLSDTEEKAVSMMKALGAALEASPVGRLRPKVRKFVKGEPIEFLGHVFTCTKNGLLIVPTAKNVERLLGRRRSILTQLSNQKLDPAVRSGMLNEYHRSVRSWCAAFRNCDNIEELRMKALSAV